MVDRDAVQILGREHIDEKLYAAFIENEIALLRFFFNIEAVLKSRTTAGNDANAKSGRFRKIVFAREETF